MNEIEKFIDKKMTKKIYSSGWIIGF